MSALFIEGVCFAGLASGGGEAELADVLQGACDDGFELASAFTSLPLARIARASSSPNHVGLR